MLCINNVPISSYYACAKLKYTLHRYIHPNDLCITRITQILLIYPLAKCLQYTTQKSSSQVSLIFIVRFRMLSKAIYVSQTFSIDFYICLACFFSVLCCSPCASFILFVWAVFLLQVFFLISKMLEKLAQRQQQQQPERRMAIA